MLIFMIIVVGIIVVCMSGIESSKNQAKMSGIREKDRQMTNARLEQATVDKYMKRGFTFDEAFERARNDMVGAGYVPCIPRSAYGGKSMFEHRDNTQNHYSSDCYHKLYGGVENYDSFDVQQRRKTILHKWSLENGGNGWSPPPGKTMPQDELDRALYSNFPKTEFECRKDYLDNQKVYALPKGCYLTYPNLGMCEVLGYNNLGSQSGTYQLKVLKTGQIVNYVRIDDIKIQRQG